MRRNKALSALKAAFPHTLPILAGFFALGTGYGRYLRSAGLPAWYPTLTGIVVFGGSLEFLLVSMLLLPFQPLSVFLLSLLVQARHIFYGLSMLEKYRGKGWKSIYLIYSMCDETFSINCSTQVPEGIDESDFHLSVSFLNQLYWVLSITFGSFVGGVFAEFSKGIEFVMTAMFIVIFVKEMEKKEERAPGAIGVLSTILCLVVFGKTVFLLPSMALILILLFVLKNRREKA